MKLDTCVWKFPNLKSNQITPQTISDSWLLADPDNEKFLTLNEIYVIIIMIMIIVVSNSMVVCGVRRSIIFINITCVSVALVSVANTGHGVAVRGSYKYDNKMRAKSDINLLL